MADHRAATRPREMASPWMAYVSLTLGTLGVAVAFAPWFNTYTALAAMAGFVVGLVGIWESRQILSGVGVVLCGTAIMLTVVAQYIETHPREPAPREQERPAGEVGSGLVLPLTDTELGVSGGC